MPGEGAQATYLVVASHEERTSIHTADGDAPGGWRDADVRVECLVPIGAVWTGTRPPALRRAEPAAR